jgi:hypothetical protein
LLQDIRLLLAHRAAFGEKAAMKEGIREPCWHVETKTGFFDCSAAIQAVDNNQSAG